MLIPYLIIHICFNFVQDFVFYRDTLSINHNFIVPISNWLLGKSEMGPMWFLVSLFVMKMVVGLYDRITLIADNYRYLLLLLISLSVALIAYSNNFNFNYFQMSSALYGLPLLVFGIIVGQYSLHIYFKNIIALLITIIATIVLFPQTHVSWNGLHFPNGLLSLYSQAIIGIMLLLTMFSFAKSTPSFVQYISSGTLFILGTHSMLIQVYKILYKLVFHITTPPPYMGWIGAVVGSLLIICLLYWPMKRLLDSENKFARFLVGK